MIRLPSFLDFLTQQAMKEINSSSTLVFSHKIKTIVDGVGKDISENLIDNVLVQMHEIIRPIVVNGTDIYELDEPEGPIAYNSRKGGVNATYI